MVNEPPRLLLVSPWSLFPPIHGGAVRIGNLIRQLSESFDLFLLIFLGGTDDPAQRQAFEPFCREVFFQLLPNPGDTASDLPPEAAMFSSSGVRERILSLLEAHRIDILVLEYAELGHLVTVAPPSTRVVLVEHDIHFRSRERRAILGFEQRFGSTKKYDRESRRRYELEACRRADQVHLMSEADRSFLSAALGEASEHLRVVPNGVDTLRYRPGEDFAERRHLLFVGSFPHLPNQDALEFFLQEIWPLLRERRPRTELTVAGARPPEWVLQLDSENGIRVVGEVDDLLPLYQSHRVLVVPLRAGSGTRLKILEALASGLPVVSTPIGAEGLDVEAGVHLALSPDPRGFVDAVLRCLDDEDWARSLSDQGCRLARERYDWRVIATAAAGFLHQLLPKERSELCHGLREQSVEANKPEPVEISLVVADRPAQISATEVSAARARDDLVARIESQRLDPSFEVIWLGSGSPAAAIRGASRQVVLEDRWDPADPAPALDRACAVARGQVLVFLGPGLLPLGDRWLHDLTTPLFAPRAPAAVQGGINAGFSSGVPRCETRLAALWAKKHRGVTFSWLNAALRREVWRAFPFASGGPHEDRRWQRRVEAAGHQVLLCWAALAEQSSFLHPLREWPAAWRRGQSWRRLGERYELAACWADLLRPRANGQQRIGWLHLLGRHPLHGLVSWSHPLIELLGNHFGRNGKGT